MSPATSLDPAAEFLDVEWDAGPPQHSLGSVLEGQLGQRTRRRPGPVGLECSLGQFLGAEILRQGLGGLCGSLRILGRTDGTGDR
jgi:hypothetical protein